MTENEFYAELGRKLTNIRTEAGVKKNKIAETLGISASILTEAEKDGKKLSAFRLWQILDFLGYEFHFLKKNPNPLL